MTTPFDLEVLQRLPLAECSLRLLRFGLANECTEVVFRQHRGRSYENIISFPKMVQLLAEGCFGQQRSAHQAFQHAIEVGEATVSVQALYGKLKRMPISLSLGLFDGVNQRLATLLHSKTARPLPDSLLAYRVLAFDGKKLKHVLRRLKPLRGLKGNIFGGKLLVVQDMATAHAVAIEAAEDGETADNPLVPGCVARVRGQPGKKPRLWVGDRAFCEYTSIPLLSSEGDSFVIRYSVACKFRCDPAEPTQTGIDGEGRSYTEEWGWLGKDESIPCRKITVARPGQQPFAIVTNLRSAERFPANDLLALYRRRWGIETMFQQVVQTFDLRHLIGSTPQATIFQAVLCFLVYNITLMIRDFIAASHKKQAEELSTKILFDDLSDELGALFKVLHSSQVVKLLRGNEELDAVSLRAYLKKTLGQVWSNRWIKAPTRKQPGERKPRAYLCGGHSSVAKILRGDHKEIPLTNQEKTFKPHEAKKDV